MVNFGLEVFLCLLLQFINYNNFFSTFDLQLYDKFICYLALSVMYLISGIEIF